MRREDEHLIDPETLAGYATPWAAGWSPEGVIEALEPMVSAERKERIDGVLARRMLSVVVVLDAPYDPHNGAAVLRSCDAFGVQRLHVVVGEPFQVARKISKGTQRWVDVKQTRDAAELARQLAHEGYRLVVTHPEGELEPDQLGNIERLALVLGNEHFGVSDTLTAAAHHAVRIPMRGFVESLNMSVSAAILLEAATKNRPGDLPAPLARTLYARGIYWSVTRARDILAALPPR